MSEPCLLVGDIGGTNARFALADPVQPGYREDRVLQCADYATAEAAIADYLASVDAAAPTAICIAAAGPVADGGIVLTNNDWEVQPDSLQQRFGTAKIRILNDFAAVARGLTALAPEALLALGPVPAPDLSAGDFTVGVIGPGTGLGAAGLTRSGGECIPLVTEAGHVGFAPECERQLALWQALRGRFGRVSNERLLSGSGLENIYRALRDIGQAPPAALPAAAIFDAVAHDPVAAEAVTLFFRILGQAAGNFALSLGAFDGIFIAGGIARRYPELLLRSEFRAGFENKGRHRALMETIPTTLVTHPYPGLLGAAAVARLL